MDGGRASEFAEWYRAYAPRVNELVLRYTGDHDLAEEVTQETFLRAYRYRDVFDDGRPVWPWLSKIAVRLTANALKRRTSRREDPWESSSLPAGGAVDGPEEMHLAREATPFAGLPPRYRRALFLKYVVGLRYSEIAGSEGIKAESAEMLIMRARKAARLALERHQEPASPGAGR